MERKADVLHCMGDLWECSPHRFPIALAFLFALKFVWEYSMGNLFITAP